MMLTALLAIRPHEAVTLLTLVRNLLHKCAIYLIYLWS